MDGLHKSWNGWLTHTNQNFIYVNESKWPMLRTKNYGIVRKAKQSSFFDVTRRKVIIMIII